MKKLKIRFDFILFGVMSVIAGIKMLHDGYVWGAPVTPTAAIVVCIFGIIVILWGIFGSKVIKKE